MDCENKLNQLDPEFLVINQVKVQKFNVSWLFKKD